MCLPQTVCVCDRYSEYGTDSLFLFKTICICHRKHFLSQTVFVCHRELLSVMSNLCLSEKVSLCRRQYVSVRGSLCLFQAVCFVTDSLCMSQTVCVRPRKVFFLSCLDKLERFCPFLSFFLVIFVLFRLFLSVSFTVFFYRLCVFLFVSVCSCPFLSTFVHFLSISVYFWSFLSVLSFSVHFSQFLSQLWSKVVLIIAPLFSIRLDLSSA